MGSIPPGAGHGVWVTDDARTVSLFIADDPIRRWWLCFPDEEEPRTWHARSTATGDEPPPSLDVHSPRIPSKAQLREWLTSQDVPAEAAASLVGQAHKQHPDYFSDRTTPPS